MDALRNQFIKELQKYCDSLLEYDWDEFYSYIEPYIDRLVGYIMIVSTDENIRNNLHDKYIKTIIPLARNDKLVIKINAERVEFSYQPNLVMGGE